MIVDTSWFDPCPILATKKKQKKMDLLVVVRDIDFLRNGTQYENLKCGAGSRGHQSLYKKNLKQIILY